MQKENKWHFNWFDRRERKKGTLIVVFSLPFDKHKRVFSLSWHNRIVFSRYRIYRLTSHGERINGGKQFFLLFQSVHNKSFSTFRWSFRRPAKKINANEDLSARPYEPLFALDWQKSSKTNVMYNRTPFIEVEPDWLFSWSKQYDSYKKYYHEIGIPFPPVISTVILSLQSYFIVRHISLSI